MEDWKPVKGWEDFYAVSSLGRVMRTAPGKKTYPGKILSTPARSARYPCVRLISGKRIRTYQVHRLVAEAFLPPPENPRSTYVAHRDGNPENPRADNLYWATPAENSFDQVRHGTARGAARPQKRSLTDDDIRAIRQDRRTAKEIAADYGIGAGGISAIRRRVTHRHVPPQEGDYVPTQAFRSFSDEDVRDIRRDTRPNSVIARERKVSANTIRDIRNRKYYSHVE